MTSVASPLDRVRSIEARRSRDAVAVMVLSVGVAISFCAAFVIGHLMGPSPIRPVEVVLGVSGVLMIALGVARPIVRRHVNRFASRRLLVREGAARRGVLLFPDHVIVDGEVILPETVESVRRSGDQLLLRYRDPVASGPLLREWSGSSRALDVLADALESRP